MRSPAIALLVLAATFTSGSATAAADPQSGMRCQEGFCEPPTINLLPSGSAQPLLSGAEPDDALEAEHA